MAKTFSDVTARERPIVTPEGKIEKVWQVGAVTAGGVYFTIDVPDKIFNKEKVGELLAARAAEIDAVLKL